MRLRFATQNTIRNTNARNVCVSVMECRRQMNERVTCTLVFIRRRDSYQAVFGVRCNVHVMAITNAITITI